MSLTILSVAFPLVIVAPDAVGGAEQVLLAIDRGLVKRGHQSIVVARPESEVAGELIPTISPQAWISDAMWRTAHESVRRAMSHVLDNERVDVVHMHGVDFADYLPRQDVPVLATLHLPLNFYPQRALHNARPRTYLNCVSGSQRELIRSRVPFLADIENGVDTEFFRGGASVRKRNFVIALGRICREKAFDVALRAAKKARISMFLAGSVYPFEDHHAYFCERIAPELDSRRRYIGPVGLTKKRRLLSAARCLIVPSAVPETSSLVAREALACGTPVVAFARGALRDVVSNGKTGFLVERESELPDAIEACRSLDPAECRRAAESFSTSDKMVERYVAAYERILNGAARPSQMRVTAAPLQQHL